MIFTPQKYTYIIVDSHVEDVERLQAILEVNSKYVCLGVAGNKEEAINLILDRLPHMVFLDTTLVDGHIKKSSFGLIQELHQFLDKLPGFIAMSTTTSSAYEAIKNGVLDYVLKPFNAFDLRKTLLRFEKRQPDDSTICIKSFTEYRFLLLRDIVYLKADNNTTDFHLTDGSVVTSYKTLKNFETGLPNCFIRIHKSFMVNINYITKIHFSKLQCTLKFAQELIPFSKSFKSKMNEIKEIWLRGNMGSNQLQFQLG